MLAMLVPLWCAGSLGRGIWTPDEPREANIVSYMEHQDERAVPRFADAPFLEKPPLYYWVAAGANAIFGHSPRAMRAPNLLYAAITVIALGFLASAMAGFEAALLASIVGGSLLLVLRVSIWLAPDACLMAGCSLALLGAYLGYTAKPGRAKLLAYSLMHVGAAMGFMAKNAPGWIFPALALLSLITWERRWSELRRSELYAGFVLQALIILPWIWQVWTGRDGAHALRVLFFDNLAGRFGTVASADGTLYSAGHKNWPGRYFAELPFALMPWTFLTVAAMRSAWIRFRAGTLNTAWRFSLAASLPFLALLSVASTARDIYAAPVALGLALAVALWAMDLRRSLARWDALALKATRVVILTTIAALCVGTFIIAATNNDSFPILLAALALVILVSGYFLRNAKHLANEGEYTRSVASCAAAFVIAIVVASAFIFPAVDRWQDLSVIGNAILRENQGRPIALLRPDETTLAMFDDVMGTPPISLRPGSQLADWLCKHRADGRLVVNLPGHAPGEISPLLGRLLRPRPPGDGAATTLERDGIATLLERYDLPHGRRYAVMAPGSMACDHRASSIDRT
jgi:4-amino-4-deoxy-L-arabinose transferase-like glycosyltransferase